MAVQFDNFSDLPPLVFQHLTSLEVFVGDVEEVNFAASSAVVAINALANELRKVSIVTDAMVKRALQGFDTGVGDPNDYSRRMRAALAAAISPYTANTTTKTTAG